jgi:hypothetical protein
MNKTAPAGTFNLEEFPSLVYTDIYNTRRTLLYVGYFCFFIFFWLRAKKKKLAVIGIFILLGSDILLANTGYEPTVETGYFKEPTENIRYVMKDESVFRVFASPYAYNKFTWVPEHPIRYGIWSSKDRFVNNRMMEFGLYDMWGYDSTGLRRNVEIGRIVYHLKTPTGNNLLNLFNVKYIAARGDIRNRGYKRVSKTRYAAVYLNKNCLQRAFLVRKPLIMNNEKQMLSYMAGRKFTPEKEIILEEHVELPQQKEANRIKKEKVNILRYRPQRVDIFVVAKMPAFLLLSDTYYPGWQAYIDGKKTHIYRADYFLRAVVVPEGKHIVRFAYEPFSFKVGAIITLFTIAALAIYSLYIIIRKFSRI